MNEILFVVTILINFIGIILAFKFWKKEGLLVWIGFATIIANIEVVKCIDLFGISQTLGNVIYGSIFLATDILSEIYGKKEAQKGVFIGFFSMIVFTLMMRVNLSYIPNADDFVSESMGVVFALTTRIAFASLFTYLISNLLDTFTFDKIKEKFPTHLWLRNNGSTMTSQLIDSILFNFIAFVGVFDGTTLLTIIISTYLIKVVIAACDTPFIYLATKIYKHDNEKIKKLEESES